MDRAALPAPECEPEPSARGAVEARLAQIMASLLEVDDISNDDNFFQAGGHPLLAALVLDRVCQVYSVTLTPNQLFEAPHSFRARRRNRAGRATFQFREVTQPPATARNARPAPRYSNTWPDIP